MRSITVRAATMVVVGAVAATSGAARRADAQSSLALTPFIGYYRSTDVKSPTTAGADLTLYGGQLGIRASGALPLSGPTDTKGSRGWDGDLDFVVRLADPAKFGVVLVPYAFGGFGGRNRPDAFRTMQWTPTRSFGGGAHIVLGRSLALSAEARLRSTRQLQPDGSRPWRMDSAPEVRVGFMIR